MILKIMLSILLGGPCCPFHDSPDRTGLAHARTTVGPYIRSERARLGRCAWHGKHDKKAFGEQNRRMLGIDPKQTESLWQRDLSAASGPKNMFAS